MCKKPATEHQVVDFLIILADNQQVTYLPAANILKDSCL